MDFIPKSAHFDFPLNSEYRFPKVFPQELRHIFFKCETSLVGVYSEKRLRKITIFKKTWLVRQRGIETVCQKLIS